MSGAPKRKLYTHMGHTHEVSYPHLSDEEIAHRVRMLMRSDLDHEAVVVGARDRLLYLIAQESEHRATIEALVGALADLTDAFLSRHGCFPSDKTNDAERHWHRAMSRAYELVGQPGTPARTAALRLARGGA